MTISVVITFLASFFGFIADGWGVIDKVKSVVPGSDTVFVDREVVDFKELSRIEVLGFEILNDDSIIIELLNLGDNDVLVNKLIASVKYTWVRGDGRIMILDPYNSICEQIFSDFTPYSDSQYGLSGFGTPVASIVYLGNHKVKIPRDSSAVISFSLNYTSVDGDLLNNESMSHGKRSEYISLTEIELSYNNGKTLSIGNVVDLIWPDKLLEKLKSRTCSCEFIDLVRSEAHANIYTSSVESDIKYLNHFCNVKKSVEAEVASDEIVNTKK